MTLDGLRMPPFNVTLMGVLRGVVDYFELPASDAMLYGASGHAFLMNVHRELCPSGPYCWNLERFIALAGNLGVGIEQRGWFSPASGESERRAVEACIRGELDAGVPCSLLNMEHQLITGYDGTGFDVVQPWAPRMLFPPGRLTFTTWQELGEEIHLGFFTFRRRRPPAGTRAVVESLRFAVDLWEHPERYSEAPYAVGQGAWDNWIAAVEGGAGSSHGAWWNGTVWSECRQRAADYFTEIAMQHPAQAATARALSRTYSAIAEALGKAADKALDAREKTAALERARAEEAGALQRVRELADRIEAETGPLPEDGPSAAPPL